MSAYPFEYVTLGKIGSLATAEICTLSLVAAFLSLRFVERPFRFPVQNAAVPRLVLTAIFAMGDVIAPAVAHAGSTRQVNCQR
jgi:peptidoglycan/LPS O-acetylase OafA/YrhL